MIRCHTCGAEIHSEGHSTGYGITREGHKICYACCAAEDRRELREGKPAMLYVYWHNSKEPSRPGYRISPRPVAVGNWTGSLKIPVSDWSRGGHNMTGCRYDVWFHAEGHKWHGVNYGTDDLIRCRVVKD
jgi:hypothetical protein